MCNKDTFVKGSMKMSLLPSYEKNSYYSYYSQLNIQTGIFKVAAIISLQDGLLLKLPISMHQQNIIPVPRQHQNKDF